jgi:hypothetical protein
VDVLVKIAMLSENIVWARHPPRVLDDDRAELLASAVPEPQRELGRLTPHTMQPWNRSART